VARRPRVGRTVQNLDLDVTAHPPIDVTQLSTPDLEALIAIFERCRSNARELVASGELAGSRRGRRRVDVESALPQTAMLGGGTLRVARPRSPAGREQTPGAGIVTPMDARAAVGA
jgi:hypothetical protein